MRQITNEELMTVRMSHSSLGFSIMLLTLPHSGLDPLWGGIFVVLKLFDLSEAFALDSEQGCEAGTLT